MLIAALGDFRPIPREVKSFQGIGRESLLSFCSRRPMQGPPYRSSVSILAI
jgi:hypothetical protein